MTESPLTPQVRARLAEWARNPGGEALLVLPSQVREGTAYYAESDVDAVKIGRAAGLDLDFLVPAEERRFLGEYSSGLTLAFAVGVLQNLSADALVALGRYVLLRFHLARDLGLLQSPDDVLLKISVGAVDITAEGVRVRDLQVEGRGEAAVDSVLRALSSSAEQLAEVRARLALERDKEGHGDNAH